MSPDSVTVASSYAIASTRALRTGFNNFVRLESCCFFRVAVSKASVSKLSNGILRSSEFSFLAHAQSIMSRTAAGPISLKKVHCFSSFRNVSFANKTAIRQ